MGLVEKAIEDAKKHNFELEQKSLEAIMDGKKLLVAMPLYDGKVPEEIFFNVLGIQDIGIPIEFFPVKGESLIQRARNFCITRFIDDADRFFGMIFIDSDVIVTPMDIRKLILRNKDLIGAPVRIKSFDELRYSVNERAGCVPDKDSVLEVDEFATGCMYLSKKLILALRDNAVKHGRTYCIESFIDDKGNVISGKEYYDIARVFIRESEHGIKNLISEDYGICRDAREIGFIPYVDFSISTGHMGWCTYVGGMIESRLSVEEYKILSEYRANKEKIQALYDKATAEGDYNE